MHALKFAFKKDEKQLEGRQRFIQFYLLFSTYSPKSGFKDLTWCL